LIAVPKAIEGAAAVFSDDVVQSIVPGALLVRRIVFDRQ
jgi:hypothetical protein